jgi:hypothetical protein
VQQIRGTLNIVADTLSRVTEGQLPHEEELVVCDSVLNGFPLVFQGLGELQREDPELERIIARLEEGESVPGYLLSRDVLCCLPDRGGSEDCGADGRGAHGL